MTYANETYLRSLQDARADIQRNVQNTLNEVTRQRDTAVRATNQIPGAVAKAGQQTLGTVNQGADAGQQGLEALGLGAIGGGALSDARAEAAGRVRGVRDAFTRAGGLMRKGFLEQATQRRGAVDQIAQQLYAQNTSERNRYIAGREAEDRQSALQQELHRRQIAQQRAAMAQQAALAREQMGFQSRESQLARSHAAQMALQQRIGAALKNKPAGMAPTLVEHLYKSGQAPPGMSLSDFYEYVGIAQPNYGNTRREYGGRF